MSDAEGIPVGGVEAPRKRGALSVLAGLLALALLGGCLASLQGSEPPPGRTVQRAGGGARLEVEGLRVVRLAGTPEEIGTQMGTLLGPEIRALAPAMLRAFAVGATQRAGARLLEPRIPDAYRRELQACASAAQVDYEDLLVANLVVESYCTVLVAPPSGERPLRVARNLDFHPASLLGQASVVYVVAPAGQRPFVSIGWPGFNAVTSGFNDAGLSTFVLINLGAEGKQLATPVGYRQRALLEGCASRAEAEERFQAEPVASGHYVVVADGASACTLFQNAQGFQRLAGSEGPLLCSNGPADLERGCVDDARTRALAAFVGERGLGDTATLRDALGVSYLEELNAQAMVIEPVKGTLELALGAQLAPAALQRGVRLELGPQLAGAPLEDLVARRLPPPGEVTHFTRR